MAELPEYSLRLYTPVNWTSGGGTFVQDVTTLAKKWRRSTRLMGGYWQGQFTITADDATLLDWFYQRLSYHVVEATAGRTTWEGLVYEMTLTMNGVSRRRSLDLMWNKVQVIGGAAVFAQDTVSQARYGLKTIRHTGWPGIDAVNQAAADAIIAEQGRAPARTVSATMGKPGANQLTVTVCGYAFTLNWRFLNTYYGATTVSTALSGMLTADAEFVDPGNIRTNSTAIWIGVEMGEVRVWELIKKFMGITDGSGNLWRGYVAANRQMHYEPVSFTPIYTLIRGKLYNNPGGEVTSPYAVTPGVWRDLEYPYTRVEQNGKYLDSRDFTVDEIEVNDGKLTPKTAFYGEADQLRDIGLSKPQDSGGATDVTDWEKAAHQDDPNWSPNSGSGNRSGGKRER